MAPQLTTLLRELRQQKSKRYDQIVVGVITNSDDRVPDILSSMGLHVSQLRYGSLDPNRRNKASTGTESSPHRMYDLGFHCMSYDVGAEKPDPRIFRAAEEMLPVALASKANAQARQVYGKASHADQQGVGPGAPDALYNTHDTHPVMLQNWDKILVGDEWEKDVVGAQLAGWYPVLLHGTDEGEPSAATHAPVAHPKVAQREVQPLTQVEPQYVDGLSAQFTVASVPSIASLLHWLMG